MDLVYVLPPAFAFVFNLILLWLVLRKHWRSFLHRIFSIFLLNIAVWSMFIFLIRASPDIQHASTWHIALTTVGHGTGLFFYHFTVILTNIKPRRWILPIGYLLWVVIAVIGATGLITTGSQIKPYGYAPIMTPLGGLYIAYLYFFITLGLINLFRSYKTSPTNAEKTRIVYVIIGVSCSLFGGLTDIFPVMGLRIYPLGIYGNLAFSLLTAIAILRHHLMDIHVVIRKGFYYLLISTIVAVPYTGSALLFG